MGSKLISYDRYCADGCFGGWCCAMPGEYDEDGC